MFKVGVRIIISLFFKSKNRGGIFYDFLFNDLGLLLVRDVQGQIFGHFHTKFIAMLLFVLYYY
jgi:hypothetical protein